MSKIKQLIEQNATPEEIILQTESYCPLAWCHLHIGTFGEVIPCCVAHGEKDKPLGDINKQTFDEIWNGQGFKDLRKSLFNDQKVPYCKICYRKEKESGISLRHNTINKFHTRVKDMVMSTDFEGNSVSVPIYLDIRFSNICNMKCRMCNHFSSSKWFADAKKMADDHNIYRYIYSKHKDGNNPSSAIIRGVENSKKLLDRLDEYLPHIQEIYFAGGEPLLMDEHYRILNRLIKLGLTDVHIRYSSNMSIMKYKGTNVTDLWKHFNSVYCVGSIDAHGNRAEIIRDQTKWNDIEKNIEMMKEEVPHVRFGMSPTIQILNAYTICDLQKNWIEKNYVDGCDLSWNILSYPNFYNIQILPQHMKNEIKEIWLEHIEFLRSFSKSKYSITLMDSAINWMMAGNENPEFLKEMCRHTRVIDKLRDQDTRSTFPELKYIWDTYWE